MRGLADKDRLELQAETDKQDKYLDIVGDALGDLTRAARVSPLQGCFYRISPGFFRSSHPSLCQACGHADRHVSAPIKSSLSWQRVT